MDGNFLNLSGDRSFVKLKARNKLTFSLSFKYVIVIFPEAKQQRIILNINLPNSSSVGRKIHEVSFKPGKVGLYAKLSTF